VKKRGFDTAATISVISSTRISLIYICYRVTPGPCRPTSVTYRSDTGALPPMPGAYRDAPWRLRGYIGNVPSQTPLHHRDRPWSPFAPNRVWSVALPGMYKRTRIASRFVSVRPGPPTTKCRDAPGLTPGQCERVLTNTYFCTFTSVRIDKIIKWNRFTVYSFFQRPRYLYWHFNRRFIPQPGT